MRIMPSMVNSAVTMTDTYKDRKMLASAKILS